MISVDMRQFVRMAKTLERDTKQGLKYAVAGALNDVAAKARIEWQRQMGERLTLRNRWTAGSVQFQRATLSGPISRMFSKVGSVSSYMPEVETGGTRTGKGRVGMAIPTTVASGEGRGGGKRRRVVRSGSRMSAIKLQQGRPGAGPRQRNAIALAIARRKGQKHVFLEGGASGTGIYRVIPSRKQMKPTMLYNLGRRAYSVKPHATLEPTLAVMNQRWAGIAEAAFVRELKRHKAFGF